MPVVGQKSLSQVCVLFQYDIMKHVCWLGCLMWWPGGNTCLMFGETSTDYACGLGIIPSDMPSGPLKIKEKSYSTDTPPPSDMPTNTVKLYGARQLQIVNTTSMPAYRAPLHYSCSIYACRSSVTALLLFKHAYWLSAAARLMLAGPLPLNQHACRSFAT